MKTIVNPFTGGLIAVPKSNIDLGTKKHTRATTPPTNPTVGDTWDELDASGILVMQWFWNGLNWLSVQPYEHRVETNNTLTATSFAGSQFVFSGNYNLLIQRYRQICRIEGAISPGGATDSITNYWTFSPRLVTGGGASTFANAPVLSLEGKTYSQFFSVFITSGIINTQITVAPTGSEPDNTNTVARGFGVAYTKIGTPPNLSNFCATLTCRFVRP